jgi:stage V sporulation protein S
MTQQLRDDGIPAPRSLRVAASSSPASVAGAIAASVRDNGDAELTAIGAAAVNQAVKAIGIARGYVAPLGVNLVCVPVMVDIVMADPSGGLERTAIRFRVMPR